jgi:hypothetical protein
MQNLTKYFGLLGCLVCLNSSVFAAEPSIAQLDTNTPPMEGALTTEQTPPILLPPAPVSTAPAAAPAATAPTAAPVSAPAPRPATAGTPTELR